MHTHSSSARGPQGHAPASAGRRAFTLIEIMIALTVFTILGAAASTFFIKQSRAVTTTAGRMDAQQNVSFAMDAIDHDLRVAGVGLGANQPMIVEANQYAVSFNADLVTKDTASVTAASYFDPNVPDSLSLSITPANKFSLPYSAVQYPDSQYWQSAGVVSNAETITYWVTLDSTTARTDDYMLLRRVNNAPPTLLARGLVFPGGAPAFRYFMPGATVNSRVEIIAPNLPMAFKVGAPADTLLAKISEVRIQLQAVARSPLGVDSYRSVNQYVPMLNAGLAHVAACPGPPAAPASLTLAAAPSGDSVTVTWPASTDETGGKLTVNSYSVYRRKGVAGPWDEPIYTSPADGVVTYTFEDKAVPLGFAYQYGIVARDCTPALSALTPSGGTVTPNP